MFGPDSPEYRAHQRAIEDAALTVANARAESGRLVEAHTTLTLIMERLRANGEGHAASLIDQQFLLLAAEQCLVVAQADQTHTHLWFDKRFRNIAA